MAVRLFLFISVILTAVNCYLATQDCSWNLTSCQESCGSRRKAILARRSNDQCPKCFCPRYECETDCEEKCRFLGESGQEVVNGLSKNWKPCDPCSCECMKEDEMPPHCQVANCKKYEQAMNGTCALCGRCEEYHSCSSVCKTDCPEGMKLKSSDSKCKTCDCECMTLTQALTLCRTRHLNKLNNCQMLTLNSTTGCYDCNCQTCPSLDTCKLQCEQNKFKKDAQNCDMCECAQVCPSLESCKPECEITQDKNGCPQCSCSTAEGILEQILKEMNRIFDILEKEKKESIEKLDNDFKTEKKHQENKDEKKQILKTEDKAEDIKDKEPKKGCRKLSKGNCKEDCHEFLVDQDGCNVCRCRKSPQEKCKCLCSRTAESENCSCECTLQTSRGVSRSKETFSASTKVEEFITKS